MSTDNPYFAPGSTPPLAAPQVAPRGAQPRGFMTICVLTIVLGLFGAMGSSLGLIGQAVAPALQALAERQKPGQPQAQHDLEVQMQRDIAAATDHWRPVMFLLQGVHLLLSIGMVTGGIFCIRRKAKGPDLLGYSCLAAVGYEVFNLVVQILVSMATFPISTRFVQKTIENAPGNAPPNMANLMGTTMQVVMWITILFLVFWTIGKIVAEVIALRYVRKPEVLAYVSGTQSVEE